MKWIKVQDSLPECDKIVLTNSIIGIHTAAKSIMQDGDYYFMPSIISYEDEPLPDVTHWAELPEPPEGK